MMQKIHMIHHSSEYLRKRSFFKVFPLLHANAKTEQDSTCICSWLVSLPDNFPPIKIFVCSLLVKMNKKPVAYKYLKQSVHLIFKIFRKYEDSLWGFSHKTFIVSPLKYCS